MSDFTSTELGDLTLADGRTLIREAYRTYDGINYFLRVEPNSYFPPPPPPDINFPPGHHIPFDTSLIWGERRRSSESGDEKLVPGYYVYNERRTLFRNIGVDGDFKNWMCFDEPSHPYPMGARQFRDVTLEDNLPDFIAQVDVTW